jgi:2-oxoglutarate ferredoxin oxidoreductase subunit alpha
MKHFLMGNQILAQAAKDAGARMMFGYPITPSTEILETWAKFCLEDKSLSILQTEDEMAAGFGTIGACLAGVPAFTATAGPGNILMQDAFVMAEALRVPMVSLIMQRGGMSTSTVIYSQEEVRLTCFGGNSEGFRIVYSTANLQELYDYTLKAFRVAWKYRWPTFLLADGYQGKMMGEVKIPNSKFQIPNVKPILHQGVNLRNCYNLEEEIGEIIVNYSDEYNKIRGEIEEYEAYQTKDAKMIVLAHGMVSAAAKMAVAKLRKEGLTIGLFRPITLRPFPIQGASKVLAKAEKIIILESAMGQLSALFKNELFGLNTTLIEVNKPALGFTPEEIVKIIIEIIT